MGHRIIFVAGYAGSGKTRVGKDLARRLPACYLDKDTMSNPFVERLLAELGQPAGDRDSERYRAVVRPLEYAGLIAAGLEAAELGAEIILSAPFLVQLTDPEWTAQLARDASERGVQLRVVWVAADLTTLQRRMRERGSPRDAKKLADWSNYAAGIDMRLDERFKSLTWRFENSDGCDYDLQLESLLQWLQGKDDRSTSLATG
jgi:predicted kinase